MAGFSANLVKDAKALAAVKAQPNTGVAITPTTIAILGLGLVAVGVTVATTARMRRRHTGNTDNTGNTGVEGR